MPDTEANQLRRIDAVVKQAEVKFALGRHAEHVEALEADQGPRRHGGRSSAAGDLVLLDGILAEPRSGAGPRTRSPYCREALAIADATGFDDIRPFAECCLAHVLMTAGDLRGAHRESASAPSRPSRRAAISGGPAGRCGHSARSRTTSASGSAASSTAAAPSSTAGRSTICASRWSAGGGRAPLISSGATRSRASRCCEEALALSPIAFDAAMVRAVRAYGLVKAGTSPPAPRSSPRPSRGSSARSSTTRARCSRCGWPRGTSRSGSDPRRAPSSTRCWPARARTATATSRAWPSAWWPRRWGPRIPRPSSIWRWRTASSRRSAPATRSPRSSSPWPRRHRAAGDLAAARAALERALEIFTSLGTVDGPPLVASLLESLPDSVGEEEQKADAP